MKVGDRVRVTEPVLVYHHPGAKNSEYNLIGHAGEVIAVLKEWQGKPISANLPVVVQFESKFRVHLREGELELDS
jgi:hypothetical protein